jgi:mono/diheme cytochrome c family protein
MTHRHCPWIAAVVLAQASRAAAEAPPTYADVASIFTGRCVVCHSGDDAPLGLRLDDAAIRKGSRNGPVVLAGRPRESELLKRVRGESTPRMPLDGPPYLEDAEIARLEAWVVGGLLPAPAADSKPASGAAAPEKNEAAVPRARPKPGEPVTYSDVEPIFKKRCVKCHMDGGIRGPAPEGLRLDRYASVVASRERAVIVPGAPMASELLRRVVGTSRPRMPLDGFPDRYLSDDDVRLLSDWIAQGAPDPDGKKAPAVTGRAVRLHGTLTALWELDGLRLQVGRGTRVDKHPSPGDRVEVRGVIEADGSVRVTRLRKR